MAQQTINIGTVANDGTGTPLRTAMGMINDNFTELYSGAVEPTYIYFNGRTIRIGVRSDNFVVDRILNPTGFAGVENIDWENAGGFGI
jgi:hypothetical protein